MSVMAAATAAGDIVELSLEVPQGRVFRYDLAALVLRPGHHRPHPGGGRDRRHPGAAW